MSPRRKNYNEMYEPKEEVKKEEVKKEEVKKEEVKKEGEVVDELEITPTEVKGKKFKFGTVINGSLNVRRTPGGEVVNVIKNGENVTIESEEGDWFKISVPYEGFVMKQFVEVR